MTRLLYCTKTQEGRGEGVFVSWNRGDEGLYSSSRENMNRRKLNEG